jgi:hypothetical protein
MKRSSAELSVEAKARAAAEREIATSQGKIDALRAEKEQAESDKADYVALNGRRNLRVGLTVAAVILAAILFVLGLPGFGVGTLVGIAIFLAKAREWASNRAVGPSALFYALVPELFGIWDIVSGI